MEGNDFMNNSYQITTTPDMDGRIVQELYKVRNNIKDKVWRNVLNTADEQIRQALIELGWTPPDNSKRALGR